VIAYTTLTAGVFTLRPPHFSDAEDALATLTDPATAQWNPTPSVTDLASAQRWLERLGDWSDGKHATFSIVDPDGRYTGSVSLHHIVLDPGHIEQGNADIGYRVAPWARNAGVATHAVDTVTAWAFERLGVQRIQLFHAVANEASCRVATKAGYQLEGVLRSSSVYGDGRRYSDHLHARLVTD
jgi:RimJ/RimL family protein N-acetyltransferase